MKQAGCRLEYTGCKQKKLRKFARIAKFSLSGENFHYVLKFLYIENFLYASEISLYTEIFAIYQKFRYIAKFCYIEKFSLCLQNFAT